jgi:predicted nucleic acid-binding protein
VLVVDANIVVEVTLERFGVEALDTLGDEQLIAPWLLWSEVPAALSAMIFRAEVSRELGESALGRLGTISVEPRHPDGLIAEAWCVAKGRGWAKTYDAEYLALAARLDGRRPPANTGAPPLGGYFTTSARCERVSNTTLYVLMESRMRWKSQVRFRRAAARKPPADKAGTGASPLTRVCADRSRSCYWRGELPPVR